MLIGGAGAEGRGEGEWCGEEASDEWAGFGCVIGASQWILTRNILWIMIRSKTKMKEKRKQTEICNLKVQKSSLAFWTWKNTDVFIFFRKQKWKTKFTKNFFKCHQFLFSWKALYFGSLTFGVKMPPHKLPHIFYYYEIKNEGLEKISDLLSVTSTI